MVNIEYANAYSEVLEILNHIPKADYNKVPSNMIELFTTNQNKDYRFSYNINKTLNEQNVSKIAKTIIAILFRDYWATPYQRERIEAKEKYDRQKTEEEKREKYNADNLFIKRKTNNDFEESSTNSLPMEIKKERFYEKLIRFIKKILKIGSDN